MSKLELVKELRAITQAGIKDCENALIEANNDIEKAIDIIKIKGKNIASDRAGRIAAEGIIVAKQIGNYTIMLEVNCQTSFVAKSGIFKSFAQFILEEIEKSIIANQPFNVKSSEVLELTNSVIGTTKENCVIRRWWIEQTFAENAQSFYYIHNGDQIGSIITLTSEPAHNQDLADLGNDLSMQIAALNPLAISIDTIPADVLSRQQNIFETQLKEANKSEIAWPKILEGKFKKFYKENCLLEQDSIVVSNTQIKKVLEDVSSLLNTKITVVNILRAQVGEGIIQDPKENLNDAVQALMEGK